MAINALPETIVYFQVPVSSMSRRVQVVKKKTILIKRCSICGFISDQTQNSSLFPYISHKFQNYSYHSLW